MHDELGTQFFAGVVQKTNVSAQAVEEVRLSFFDRATRPYYGFGRPGVRRRHPEALALRPEGHAAAIRVLRPNVVRVAQRAPHVHPERGAADTSYGLGWLLFQCD